MGSNKNYRKCPDCGKVGLTHQIGQYKTIFFAKGKEQELVVDNVEWDTCEFCGVKYLDPAATKKVTYAKYKVQGLFTPDDIVNIRKCLGLSQKEIAKLLKVGEKTYTRWEKGTHFQTKSLNESLKNLVIQYNLPFEISEDYETKKIRDKIKAKLGHESACKKDKKEESPYNRLFPTRSQPAGFNPRLGFRGIYN